jgi:hypothetical protein
MDAFVGGVYAGDEGNCVMPLPIAVPLAGLVVLIGQQLLKLLSMVATRALLAGIIVYAAWRWTDEILAWLIDEVGPWVFTLYETALGEGPGMYSVLGYVRTVAVYSEVVNLWVPLDVMLNAFYWYLWFWLSWWSLKRILSLIPGVTL